MKRVLIFSLTYHPYVGGAEIALKEITDRIDSNEYEFHMVTLRFDRALPKVERFGNVLVHRIGFTSVSPKVSDRSLPFVLRLAKLLFPFTAFLKALQLHWKYGYYLTWAMMANQAGFAALFFKYLYPRVPYLLELQDGRSVGDMTKRRRILLPLWALYTRIYHKADKIKAISRFIEREVRALGYRGGVAVIPNAVDTARFARRASEGEVATLAAKFGKKPGDVLLFTASRLVLSRGVEDTIRALIYLPNNVKLLIAGSGEDQEKLEGIAKDTGVTERVRFAGHVSHDQLPAYYQLSDIFVRPSIIEGFGNVFVEAFAAGIPVVATPVGGIPDFLFDPENSSEPTGIFCAVRDPESVARAVQRYLNDPGLTARIVGNAKALALKKYDWDTIALSMESFFQTGQGQ
ncbi:MAG TPA: glycosyltransferase family 4 protein [Candidatus Paceibacterota bacterium]|jgi:glycosyltransferase involved in cell wall biosynthesis